ncbi:Calcium-binding [Seminavis robusta]|uniref:Calcium-binding n=1 Tax=Seminavis robusta TaxID=568900 RepID=A0A9N8HNI2_9STRA|nr:Calcium-binding [Seminavis robusta]|eukprot:Sro1215_g253230.1 Calcium-binding (235) ;mRNA; r:27650-28354
MPSKLIVLAILCTFEVSSSFVVSNGGTRLSPHLPNTGVSNVPGLSPLFSTPATDSDLNLEQKNRLDGLHRDADVIFSVIDADGSGTISRDELTSHLSASGFSEQVIDKIFAKLDKNKDESISQEEFRTGFAILPGLQSAPGLGNFNAQFVKELHQDADQAFQAADADGNGSIDEFELKSHLGRMFGKYSEKAIENMFQLLDVNGDENISKEEFRDAFVRYSALRQAVGEGPNFK